MFHHSHIGYLFFREKKPFKLHIETKNSLQFHKMIKVSLQLHNSTKIRWNYTKTPKIPYKSFLPIIFQLHNKANVASYLVYFDSLGDHKVRDFNFHVIANIILDEALSCNTDELWVILQWRMVQLIIYKFITCDQDVLKMACDFFNKFIELVLKISTFSN